MDSNTKKSLEEIINYLYHDERKDYEASDVKEHHIFLHIQRVEKWLKAIVASEGCMYNDDHIAEPELCEWHN